MFFTKVYQISWNWIWEKNFSEFHHGCLKLYGPSACCIIKCTYTTNDTASTTDIAIPYSFESNKDRQWGMLQGTMLEQFSSIKSGRYNKHGGILLADVARACA